MDSEVDELKRRNKELESQIYFVRCALIDSLPEHLSELLNAHFRFKTREELAAWEEALLPQLCEEAMKDERAFGTSAAGRAPCPLCHSVNSVGNPFTVPEGLYRHLLGEKGALPCVFFRAMQYLLSAHVQ